MKRLLKLTLFLGILLLPAGAVASTTMLDSFLAATTSGPASSIRLNEVLANPTGTDTGNEWIELHNDGSNPADLTGLKLARASGVTLAILSGVLEPGAYAVIGNLTGSLVNTGDTIRLLNGTVELDQLTYGGTGAEGWSWVRLPGEDTWTATPTPGSANLLTLTLSASPTPTTTPVATPGPAASPSLSPAPTASPTPMPTPTPASTPSPSPAPSPTPITVPTPAPGDIWINELLANPAGTDSGNEWLEILNQTDQLLDIGGLAIKRASGDTLATVPAGTILAAGGYLHLANLTGSLVNAGDTLTLLAGATEIDQISYDGDGPEGSAWARLSADEGAWTTILTPGQANQFPVAAPETVTDTTPVTTATGTAATTKAPAKTAKKAATKKAAAKKATAKAGKLPTGGPNMLWYLVPIVAGLYCYRKLRW